MGEILKDTRELKFFSIIIPTYNRKDLLGQTLKSFSEQTYPRTKFEVVIIDDGSTDGTDMFIQEFSKSLDYSLKYFKQKNKGRGAARNKGVELASGEIVFFTGDDCISDPRLLEEHNRNYQETKNNNCGVLGYTTIHPDIEDTPLIEYLYMSGHQFGYQALVHGKEISFEYYYTTNLSLPREKFIEIGGFEEEFPYEAFEDIELGYRLTSIEFKVLYNKNAVTYHKHPVDLCSLTRRSIHIGESAILFYQKHSELKDWGIGIDALVNPSLRCNFYDSLIKYAQLLGMERALRKKRSIPDPEIEKFCELLEDKHRKYNSHLERIILEKNTEIRKLQDEIAAVKQSMMWIVTTALNKKCIERLLPYNTRRRRYYEFVRAGGKILINDGYHSFSHAVAQHFKKGINRKR
jgi:glycosyltransferase involved in cell wall biosynthesis